MKKYLVFSLILIIGGGFLYGQYNQIELRLNSFTSRSSELTVRENDFANLEYKPDFGTYNVGLAFERGWMEKGTFIRGRFEIGRTKHTESNAFSFVSNGQTRKLEYYSTNLFWEAGISIGKVVTLKNLEFRCGTELWVLMGPSYTETTHIEDFDPSGQLIEVREIVDNNGVGQTYALHLIASLKYRFATRFLLGLEFTHGIQYFVQNSPTIRDFLRSDTDGAVLEEYRETNTTKSNDLRLPSSFAAPAITLGVRF